MASSIDNCYKIYYKAKEVAERDGSDDLSSVLEDIGSWLSGWETWEERGSDPNDPEKPDTEYRGKPTVANMNAELAFAGYKATGGKNPTVRKIK